MLAAGLLAQKANQLGLKTKPWVKTSLAPGSKVVSDYLKEANLLGDLEGLGFNIVGYGCTTCIGNSGPLPDAITDAIRKAKLTVTSVLSGNRNFEGRISPDVRANYLASPPLVVAYALAGTMDINLATDPIAQTPDGKDVYLKDIWPTTQEVAELVEQTVTREAFLSKYADVFKGDEKWQAVEITEAETYDWPAASTYIQNPPYFQDMSPEPGTISNIEGAKVLAILGDMVTTDHISPAGSFATTSPAGQYLIERQVQPREFNSYGSRRGNHEVMMRGTFANIRIKNEMLDGVEGGYTKGPDGAQTSIFEAAMAYQEAGVKVRAESFFSDMQDQLAAAHLVIARAGASTVTEPVPYPARLAVVRKLLETIEPSLQVIELLTAKIKEFDKRIAVLCEEKYPETAVLRQVGGVGPITALTFRLVVGDPEQEVGSIQFLVEAPDVDLPVAGARDEAVVESVAVHVPQREAGRDHAVENTQVGHPFVPVVAPEQQLLMVARVGAERGFCAVREHRTPAAELGAGLLKIRNL